MENWVECLKSLKGSKCQCGEKKKPRRTFCEHCFSKLPVNLRRDLFDERWLLCCQAYNKALTFLDK